MKTFLCLLFCFLSFQLFAQSIPPKPEPAIFVNDFAKIFSSTEISMLEQKLKAYDDSTSTQIVIATVQNLQGFSIKDFANVWARNWGIGQKGKDNGILILYSQEDRKIRIETGYGNEGALPDAVCVQILDNKAIPNFKKGDFYNGFEEAISEIIFRLKGEFQQDKSKLKEDSAYWSFLTFFGIFGAFIIRFFIWIISLFIRPNRFGKKIDKWQFSSLKYVFPFGILIYMLYSFQMYLNVNAILIGLAVTFFIVFMLWIMESEKSNRRRNRSSSSSSDGFYSSSSSSDSSWSSSDNSSSWSDNSSSSDSGSSSSDSSFGGGDFGGGGGDSSW